MSTPNSLTVQLRRDHGQTYPTINVKHHFWWPEIRDVRHDHEFGADEAFIGWADREYNAPCGSPAFDTAEAIVRENFWDEAQELAEQYFGSHAKVWSSGRSGGWLIVDGLISDADRDAGELRWTPEQVADWASFRIDIEALVADADYQFFWHLHENVYRVWQEVLV